MLCLAAACAVLVAPLVVQQRPPVLDPAQRLANHHAHLAMAETTPLGDATWQFIGPEIMSGRITEVAVPRTARYTIYAASASGGVWRTDNEGTTWQPISDSLPSGSVGALAVDPRDPKTVWVGLGEANVLRSSMAGTGVYRSRDAGAHWQHLGLAATHTIARIVLHPTDPDVAWVAAGGHEWTENPERGVFRTGDGGATWQRTLFVDGHTGAIDLALDPSDSLTLYAATWDRQRRKWSDPKPGPGSGIFKSRDGGRTWQRVWRGLPATGAAGRIGLAPSPSRPGTVYAVVDNHETGRPAEPGELDSYGRVRTAVIKGAEVYRSDDYGEHWRLVSEPSDAVQSVFSTYGWVFGQIRVDPTDADTVYVLGVSLLRSTDGGRTFAPLRYRGLHGDHHALWIDPDDPRHLVNGNDGGVDLSYDRGATWRDIDNLGCVQFYNVAVDMARPFRVYGSIQDNGCYRGPSTHRPGRDAGNQWQPIPGGEASYLQVDPGDENVLYSESFYGQLQRSTLTPARTEAIAPTAGADEPALRGQWLAPFLLSPHNSAIVYHGMQALFRSVDRGEHWQRLSDDLTDDDPEHRGDIPYQTITAVSESPRRFGVLYAGTDDGHLHATRDGGATWRERTDGIVPGVWISRVVASAFDDGTVYCAQNGKRDDDFQAYLWASRDYGATWRDLAPGLPGGPVNVVREDPRDPRTLYVGTDQGVYATVDGGSHWHVLGNGLPIVFVHDLIVHPRDLVLVAATHGRGMWTLDVKKLRPL